MEAQPKTTVVIVDDHRQIVQSTARDLQRSGVIDVVGTCHNARVAEALALSSRPDVVLFDVIMEGRNPFESCWRITRELAGAVRVLFWTGHPREDFLHRCRAVGGAGIISKGDTYEELVSVIQHVAAGHDYYSPYWERRLQALKANNDLSPVERLTSREIAVIHRLAAGDSTSEIADYVELSQEGVRQAIRTAMEKLGSRNESHLVYQATLECVVTPSLLV